MEIEFSRLTPDDWQKVRDLRLRALREEPVAFGETPEEGEAIPEEEWRKRLSSKTYLFAVKDGMPVGMVATIREKREKLRHIVDVKGVYVAPEARGQGVASKLLQQAMDESAREENTVKFVLSVAQGNTAAHALYQKLGFHDAGVMEKEMNLGGHYTDEIRMERIIG